RALPPRPSGPPRPAAAPGRWVRSPLHGLTREPGPAFVARMEAVRVPPVERCHEEHREPVLAQLRGMLGREASEDAFQETFLRALRAYPTLKHGRHLRAWALAIAHNVAIDALREHRVTSAAVPDP